MLRRCLSFLVMRAALQANEKQQRAANHRRTQKKLHPNNKETDNRPRTATIHSPSRPGTTMTDAVQMQERTEEFRKAYGRVHREIGKVIVGHSNIVHGIL